MRTLISVFTVSLMYVTMVFSQAALDIQLTASDSIDLKNGLAIGVDTAAI
jgi:hypothetical protein